MPAPDHGALALGSLFHGRYRVVRCGFRLPTVAELHTLVDVAATGPTIDAEAFPNTPADAFWSSTPDAAATGKVWAVNFADGTANVGAPALSFYARCVK